MNLAPDDLAQLVRIVDGIYEGKPAPRVRGRFGQFLRACERGRLDVQQVLARHGLATRAGGWVPGDEVGPVSVRLLGDLRATVPSELWGPVERAPALCEQLGVVADLTLWTSARSANRVRVLIERDNAETVRLSGRYRWFAPGRVTPGESAADVPEEAAGWENNRHLKAVAEDVGRPPHPLEYVVDYRLGRPGLKVFRVMSGRWSGDDFDVLPVMMGETRRVSTTADGPGVRDTVGDESVALLFAYREPWDDTWHPIAGKTITKDECFEHAIAWGDFRAEVLGQPRLAYGDVAAIRDALASVGVQVNRDAGFGNANLTRSLLAPAASLVRWFRFRA